MPSARLTVLLASLLCGSAALCSTVLAQSITPKFAWPSHGTAEVSTSGWTAVRGGPQDDSSSFRTVGQLTSTGRPDGWVIANGPTKAVEGQMLQIAGLDAFQAVVTRHIVSTDGRFVRLEDTAALRLRVDSASRQLLAQMPAQVREAMAGAFSVQTLGGQARRPFRVR